MQFKKKKTAFALLANAAQRNRLTKLLALIGKLEEEIRSWVEEKQRLAKIIPFYKVQVG